MMAQSAAARYEAEPPITPMRDVNVLKEELRSNWLLLQAANLVAAPYWGIVCSHISARIDETRFLIACFDCGDPSEPGDFTVASTSGTHLYGSSMPAEWPIHATTYARRPEVGSVARVHSVHAEVLSVVGEPVRSATYGTSLLGTVAPLHEVPYPICTMQDAHGLLQSLDQADAISLRGNGQVVLGGDVREACARARCLDDAARIQRAALATGRPLIVYTEVEINRIRETWKADR